MPIVFVVSLVAGLWWRHRDWFCLQPERWLDEPTMLVAEKQIGQHFTRNWENAYIEVPFNGERVGGYLSICRDGLYTFYLKGKRIRVALRKQQGGWLPACRYAPGSFQSRFARHLGLFLETRLFN
ncbi:hypothetical protein C7T94_15390 [Pedobacter yulinensis]|uniref:Uncharacterized protein n=1 Tax=Pedobacter yulinensis TaxID=2126353 RepID=A0A2T3HIC2_9SPHI|nr:hypothetical protein C7T94_15390 [Pedobacter yulinensis]